MHSPSATPASLILPGLLFLGHLLLLKAEMNQALFIQINQLGQAFSEEALALLTDWGNGTTAGSLWLLLLMRRPQWLTATLLASVTCALVISLLKHYFNVGRPAMSVDEAYIVGEVRLRYSLPSGHTATVFLLAGLAWQLFTDRFWACCLLGLAILVGLSRIAVGAHWPQDVALGALLGWLIAIMACRLQHKLILPPSWQLPLLTLLTISVLTAAVKHPCDFPEQYWLHWQRALLLGGALLANTWLLITHSRFGQNHSGPCSSVRRTPE
ncbi:phosphatase PAP2 family protein [Shewanella algae]|uniref:phosphatase PAP2 family protein n=1 Tax=Shewanella algae TaxID=38313 RepID=UPI0031F59629